MKKDPHLLVDGYNAIFSLYTDKPISQKNLIEKHIDTLVDDLLNIFYDKNTRVTIVLDGNKRDIEIVRPTNEIEFSLVYSAKNSSADAVIQSLVENAKDTSGISVASNDNALSSACGALGAEIVSINQLSDWISACKTRIKSSIHKSTSKNNMQWKNPPRIT